MGEDMDGGILHSDGIQWLQHSEDKDIDGIVCIAGKGISYVEGACKRMSFVGVCDYFIARHLNTLQERHASRLLFVDCKKVNTFNCSVRLFQ